MIEKIVNQGKKFFGPARVWVRRAAAVVFLAMFLLGYNLSTSEIQQCSAQVVPAAPTPGVAGGTCAPAANCTGTTCEPPNTAEDMAFFLVLDFRQKLISAATALENFLYQLVNDMLKSEYIQVLWLEQEMIDWLNTMWSYNLLPGLQGMTRQLNSDLALQALQLQSNADASAAMEVDRAVSKHQIKDEGISPGEQVCVAATAGSGFTRAEAFSRGMMQAWETESLAVGLNSKNIGSTPPPPGQNIGALGAAGSMAQLYQDYTKIFCDPLGNSGKNLCTAAPDPKLTNADVLPVKYIYNNLTIGVDDPVEGANTNRAVEDIISYMVGLPAADPMPAASLTSPTGEEGYLLRRSYLARYAAIRSVPDMIAGWRMPGSQMGQWIQDLRQSAYIDPNLTSKNPSYKEIMHALSVDRFNAFDPASGGTYATKMMADESKIEMEKLDLSVFYLMQLRDYYELLERTALTLSVQVSLLSGQQALPPVHAAMPLK